jgi:GTP:adenosylcobinamide-phosphate guanylyltransferase
MPAAPQNGTTPSLLVLAGRRGGVDRLGRAGATTHKAMLSIAGTPMLVRVVRTLRSVGWPSPLTVSIDDPVVLEGSPELAGLLKSGEVAVHRSLGSPSRSVHDHLASLPGERPLLVTTADHPLLRPEMIAWFWDRAATTGADLVVGLVTETVFRRRFPTHPRTLIRLGSEAYSGSNLFAFLTPAAARVAEFWVEAEPHRKNPVRMVRVFGLTNLALFVTGRLDLEMALDRASRRIGARLAAVELPWPEAAMDVDNPADLEAAEHLLAG